MKNGIVHFVDWLIDVEIGFLQLLLDELGHLFVVL